MTRLWITGEAIEVAVEGTAIPARFTWRDQSYTVAEVVKRWRLVGASSMPGICQADHRQR